MTGVVTMSLSSPAPFDYDDESRSTAGLRWPIWLRKFETFILGSGVTNEDQKVAILLHVVGESVVNVYDTLALSDKKYLTTSPHSKTKSTKSSSLVSCDRERPR